MTVPTSREATGNTISYDDSAWSIGPAPLGYGRITDIDLATTVSYGDDAANKPITTYLRRVFDVDAPNEIGLLEARYIRDDGVVIYLNGVEVERSNLPEGPVAHDTPALASIGGGDESLVSTVALPSGLLRPGANLVAVELHQHRPNSSDLVFALELVEVTEGVALSGDSVVRARALSGGAWSALEEEVLRSTDPQSSLVVSEIMYHPAEPSAAEIAAGFDDDNDFEFLEIRNVGLAGLLLDGMRFTRGVDTALTGTLSPGSYGIIVANRDAFEFRYGAGLPVIAEWQAGDRLDNGGEQIRLRSSDGTVVREFAYGDDAPWPTAPDGGGFSLVLVAPQTLPDHSLASSWRQSASGGGTPGSHDGTTFSGGDAAALLSYASDGVAVGGETVTVRLNPLADDVAGTLEQSSDFETWQPVHVPRIRITPIVDGYAEATYPIPAPAEPLQFFRYRVELR